MFISKDCTYKMDRMPRVKQNSMPTSLHYALTDSQCSKCGRQLEWSANFNDINQPKYISQHCDQEYTIRVDSVKVEMMTSVIGGRKAAKDLEDEPGAIKVAKGLKDNKKKN
jgi:NAD-dependent SIR2 family protein deacetylase